MIRSVWTTNDLAVAAAVSVDPDRWLAGLDELMGRVAGRFVRVELRRRARAFVLGLLAGLPRTNCWTIAELAGEAGPDGMQHLLARAVWDADLVREDLRDYVMDHLADAAAVPVVDENGDVKKGTKTVGVQRQYTGTAGRIENSQVGVYLVYAAAAGQTFIDRALYLPRSWTEDEARMDEAGVPAGTGFATKPALARQMLARALDAGTPAAAQALELWAAATPACRLRNRRRRSIQVGRCRAATGIAASTDSSSSNIVRTSTDTSGASTAAVQALESAVAGSAGPRALH
jgi:hypothetical protein